MHECNRNEEFGKISERLKRVDNHLHEADMVGGYRDRFTSLERDVSQLKKVGWIVYICATIGGIVGNSIPQLGKFILSLLK